MAGDGARLGWLIGRSGELQAIDSSPDETVATGATLVLSGEPGDGKTALLTAAAKRAAARDGPGGGVEYETPTSVAGWYRLVDPRESDPPPPLRSSSDRGRAEHRLRTRQRAGSRC